MIYALTRQDQVDNDCRAIAQAILDRNSEHINRYVFGSSIVHVMHVTPEMNLFCIYCRIPVFATDARPPDGYEAQNPWHFEHRRTGIRPGECIGYVREPPTPNALQIENPRNHGCYVQLGCENELVTCHRTRCHTINRGITYCHLARQFSCI